jgi:PAS domain-containing protein
LIFVILRRLEGSHRDLETQVQLRTEEVRESEALLLQSKESLRRILESLPDITWTADSTGKTTYISPNVHDVLGAPSKTCSLGPVLFGLK